MGSWEEFMQRLFRVLSSASLVLLATLFSSNVLRADTTGSISGIVRDRSQAVVAGASAEGIASLAAVDAVVSDAAVGDVVSRQCVHGVVPAAAEQDVVPGCAVEGVGTARSLCDKFRTFARQAHRDRLDA